MSVYPPPKIVGGEFNSNLFWSEDEKTLIIGENMNKLMSRYDLKLDIIYDDPQFNYTALYKQIYYWNNTIV